MSPNPYESRPENTEELAKVFEAQVALRKHYRAGNERLEQVGFTSDWKRKVLIAPEAREEYNEMIRRGNQEFEQYPNKMLPEDMIVLVGERVPDPDKKTLYTIIDNAISVEELGGKRTVQFPVIDIADAIREVEARWEDKEIVGIFHTHPLIPTHTGKVWGVESWLSPGDKKQLRAHDKNCPGFLAGLAVPGTKELVLAYWDKDNNNARSIGLKDIKVERTK